jgi:manganese/zinc/iron transport system permease protein
MITLAITIAIFSSLSGYWLAHFLDASISGSMASMLGFVFLTTYILAPSKGLIAVLIRQKQQKREFSLLTFLLHIKNHSNIGSNPEEREISHLTGHFNWQKDQAKLILDLALKNSMISVKDQRVTLTPKGADFTSEALDYIVNNQRESIDPVGGRFLLFR